MSGGASIALTHWLTNVVPFASPVVLLCIWLAMLAAIAWLLWKAPRGWEDQRGFHHGEEPGE